MLLPLEGGGRSSPFKGLSLPTSLNILRILPLPSWERAGGVAGNSGSNAPRLRSDFPPTGGKCALQGRGFPQAASLARAPSP